MKRKEANPGQVQLDVMHFLHDYIQEVKSWDDFKIEKLVVTLMFHAGTLYRIGELKPPQQLATPENICFIYRKAKLNEKAANALYKFLEGKDKEFSNWDEWEVFVNGLA